jgi:hypothetical protein
LVEIRVFSSPTDVTCWFCSIFLSWC